MSVELKKKRAVTPAMHHMIGQTSLGRVAGEKKGPTPGFENDPFEIGDFATEWIGGTIGEQLTPIFVNWGKQHLPTNQWFGDKYGPTVASRSMIWGANTAVDLMTQPLAHAIRSALHGIAPSIAGDPGPWVDVTPANLMAGSLVKTVATGVAKTWLMSAWAPKPAPAPAPPPPAPAPAPGNPPPPGAPTAAAGLPGQSPQSATIQQAPAADAATGPTFLGHDLHEIGTDVAMSAVNVVLSNAYDATVGPIVQKAINTVMGKGADEVKKPKALNVGNMVSQLASVVLFDFVGAPFAWNGPGAGTPAAIIGASLANGLLTSAFDSVYSRSLGPAIADKVNELAGNEVPQRTPATYTGERVLRSVTRGALSGGAYYATSSLSSAFFAGLGASMGGPVGAAVAMAGPLVAGMAAGTLADALLGDFAGKLGGDIYSWVTGRPKGEDRPEQQPAAEAQKGGDGKPAGAAGAAAPAAGGSAPPPVPAPTPSVAQGTLPAAPGGAPDAATAAAIKRRKAAAAALMAATMSGH